eukprot:NODE_8626_length_1481_cov_3.338257.p1 GENE.NODE_8626_length_1481_cov_3.338257~~NODE_8626_length_1481_cov_3.338257.p1  ORF type:complete len:361 (+),score=69.97 NODE_8626_length_1481_cov_3.338257:66-1148(+)
MMLGRKVQKHSKLEHEELDMMTVSTNSKVPEPDLESQEAASLGVAAELQDVVTAASTRVALEAADSEPQPPRPCWRCMRYIRVILCGIATVVLLAIYFNYRGGAGGGCLERGAGGGRFETGARLVFTAGLEGSGHHLMRALLALAFPPGKPGLLLERFLPPSQWVGPKTWQWSNHTEVVAKLKGMNTEAHDAKAWFWPLEPSYPMGVGHFHAPKVDWVARSAAEAHANFHVIFLYRSILKSLTAGCRHRRYQRCSVYFDTLVNYAEILIKQLRAVDLARVHCFRYGETDSMINALSAAYGQDTYAASAVTSTFHSGMNVHAGYGQEADERFESLYVSRATVIEKKLLDLCVDAERATHVP